MESNKDLLAQRIERLKATALSTLGRLDQEASARESYCNLKSPCQFICLTFSAPLRIRREALLASLGPELTAKFDINRTAIDTPAEVLKSMSKITEHPSVLDYFYLDLRLPLSPRDLSDTASLLASLDEIEGVELSRIFLVDYSQYLLASLLTTTVEPRSSSVTLWRAP